MRVIIQPDWSLTEAIEAAYAAYIGGGLQSTHYKMSVLMAWANVVGRTRAVRDLEELYKKYGSRAAFADALGISKNTIRKIDTRFRSVPDHSVVPFGAPTQDTLDALDYLERLGGGAYGNVWHARDALGRSVAVKFMHDDDDEAQASALHHAQALARTGEHPNIVTIFYCRALPHPIDKIRKVGIVMDMVNGETLTKRLNRVVSTDEMRKIALGVADAVSFIHARGLVHGDLHSENVLIKQDGYPVVIDLLNTKGLSALTTNTVKRHSLGDVEDLKFLILKVVSVSEAPNFRVNLDNEAWHNASNAVEVRHLFDLHTKTSSASSDRPVALQFLEDWNAVESAILTATGNVTRANFSIALSSLVERRILPESLVRELYSLRSIRNQFVHGQPEVVTPLIASQLLRVRESLHTILS